MDGCKGRKKEERERGKVGEKKTDREGVKEKGERKKGRGDRKGETERRKWIA